LGDSASFFSFFFVHQSFSLLGDFNIGSTNRRPAVVTRDLAGGGRSAVAAERVTGETTGDKLRDPTPERFATVG